MAADLAITASDFEAKVLQSDQPVLVDFWATWCRPCLHIAPFVEEVAHEFAGQAKVYKLDVDADGEIATNYGIMSIPALLVFKDGAEVDRMVGANDKAAIAAFLAKYVN